jgi:TonB family protein
MSDAWRQFENQVVDNKYPLRQCLSGSEMSAVFLTELREMDNRKAAIKLVSVDPANAELQLYRWKQAAKLSHPHLLQIFQAGRCCLDNRTLLYVVMEYAEENLAQVLPMRPLTTIETRAMLEPALDALGYIHGSGFVHGRLTPANILAIEDKVKISSDTLVEVGDSADKTAEPTAYDSPETAVGRAVLAADIWSLGVTIVEVLTQHLPAWNTSQAEPVFPETLPQPFLSIARQCLRRDPAQRPAVADITELLGLKPFEWKQVQKQVAPAAARAVETRPPAPPQRRNPFPALAGVTVLLALIAGWILLRHHASNRPASSANNPLERPSIASPEPTVPPSPPLPPAVARGAAPPQSGATLLPRSADPARQDASPDKSGAAVAPPGAPTGAGHTAVQVAAGNGEVIHQVLPQPSPSAKASIHGTLRVNVRVHVDPAGKVAGAELDSPGPSKYFADLALRSARDWTFGPAQAGGAPVASDWLLRFEFRNDDTLVIPVKTSW